METTTKDGFKEVLRDPAFRAKIREEATQIGTPGRFSGQWEEVDVVEVARDSNTQYEGKTIAEIAIELSRDPLDVFLDLGISEDLKTQFSMRMLNTNEEKVKDVLDHPYSVIGQSDAGAHVSLLCDAAFGPYLLGRWVRERQDFMLEHAIKLVTSRQAQIYGIKDPVYCWYNSKPYGDKIHIIVGNNRMTVAKKLGIKTIKAVVTNFKADEFPLKGEVLETDE